MTLTSIVVFLFLICIAGTFYLAKILFFQLKNSQNHLSKDDSHSNDNPQLSKYALLGKKAPYFKLQSCQGKQYDLDHLSKNNLLLIFVDTTCPYCYPHLESLYLNTKNLKINIKFVLMVINAKDAQDEKAYRQYSDHIYQLYRGHFLVLQADEHVFHRFKVRLLPTYMYINTAQIVEHVSDTSEDILSKILPLADQAT